MSRTTRTLKYASRRTFHLLLSPFRRAIWLLLIAVSIVGTHVVGTSLRLYKVLQRRQPVRFDSPPLSTPLQEFRFGLRPPQRRKVLVLDLDETLIHSLHDAGSGLVRASSSSSSWNYPSDFTLRLYIDRHPVRFRVHKRPHVDFFLEQVSQWYDLVVFTASMEIYGAAVADHLDRGRGILRRRFYRQHCRVSAQSSPNHMVAQSGGYTKDLTLVHRDLSSIMIIDNSPQAYRDYQKNAIAINSWYFDPQDQELLALLPVLDSLRFVQDVRTILARSALNPSAMTE